MREAPLTHEIVLLARQLPLPQRDPPDRFLAAIVQILDLTLVTAEDNLLRLGQSGPWRTDRGIPLHEAIAFRSGCPIPLHEGRAADSQLPTFLSALPAKPDGLLVSVQAGSVTALANLARERYSFFLLPVRCVQEIPAGRTL